MRLHAATAGVAVACAANCPALGSRWQTIGDGSHHPFGAFNVEDVRVCELAVSISEAQRREILEMEWLIDDIAQNGPTSTPDEAHARPVPVFDRPAHRQCPSE